jgi:hypothetical protein
VQIRATAQGISYFTSQGWTKEQAAGIMANLSTEPNLRENAKGDSGAALGIGQWHLDRQANFAKVFGHGLDKSTYPEQLAFVDWELNNMTARALIAHGGPQRLPTRAAPSLVRALRDARGSLRGLRGRSTAA